jgi:hypothetical protein
MSAHTPGPWKVDQQRRAHGYNVAVFSGDIAVADVPGIGKDPANDPEADANARLIAAAPELLGALDDLAWIVEAGRVEPVARAEVDERLERARAAIAKAEGR